MGGTETESKTSVVGWQSSTDDPKGLKERRSQSGGKKAGSGDARPRWNTAFILESIDGCEDQVNVMAQGKASH